MSSSGRRATMNDAPATGTVVVCFAVPDESRLFTRGLDRREVVRGRYPLPTIFGELDGRRVAVVHTGIGDSPGAREHLALRFARLDPPPRVVVSAGYAGALQPGLVVSDLILGENHSTPELAAKARACLANERLHTGRLVTALLAVESAAAKTGLHAATGALAVDMETAWIAGACGAAGLPLLSLRVISDAADQDFPVPGRVLYDAVRQRPRYLALPAWLAFHPGRIAPFARFVRGLGPARRRLTDALRIVLAGL